MTQESTDTAAQQAIFDLAWAGLKSQGFERSVVVKDYCNNQTLVCALRGEDNRRCAIGWAIRDEDYTPDMEGRDISDLTEVLSHSIGMPAPNVTWLKSLRAAHDMWEIPHRMEWSLRSFARMYRLKINE